MFNQNNEEKKLDWMYKGPTSMVEREEYLLGRSVDKSLEQLNDEEKQKQQGLITIPKNRVEHECIPPSIRDFNKVVQAEQVDLSAKLQEDPLVAIKKREEESRRQFLQNPVQLKKLQKALKAQQAKKDKKKKKKSKHSDDSGSDLESKLTEKLLGKKDKKMSKEERDLDTILIHKYEEFKDKLTESDLQDILNGKISDSDDSSDEDEVVKKKSKKKRRDSSEESEDERNDKNKIKYGDKNLTRREDFKRKEISRYDSSDDNFRKQRSREPKVEEKTYSRRNDQQDRYKRTNFSNNKNDAERYRNRNRSPQSRSDTVTNDKKKSKQNSDSTNSDSDREKSREKVRTSHHPKQYDSDDEDSSRKLKRSYGLVNSDGVKIPLTKKHTDKTDYKPKPVKASEPSAQIQKHKAKKLTEEEKDKLRREMMENAVWRDQERIRNVKKYRETEAKEKKEQDFDPEFVHKQLLKSAHSSSVESRIKANLNNIQRSSRDMDKHFSRRQ